jgi:predicted dehydrogenase
VSYIENFASRVGAKSGRQFVINGPGGQIWSALSERTVNVYPSHRKGESGASVNYSLSKQDGGHEGADNAQLQHIIDCLDGRSENALRGEIGREAVLLAEAIQIAARERRVVDVRGTKG